jgi:hypothetical protein
MICYKLTDVNKMCSESTQQILMLFSAVIYSMFADFVCIEWHVRVL